MATIRKAIAMHCAFFTVYLCLCMDRCRNTQEIQNSFLFCISFVFTLWSFYCGQGFTEGSSVWQLALCQVHTRTCSHCIPRCSSMCMCVRVPLRACTCVLTYTCITGILLSSHLLWIVMCSYLPIITPPPRPLSGKVYSAPTHGRNLILLSNIERCRNVRVETILSPFTGWATLSVGRVRKSATGSLFRRLTAQRRCVETLNSSRKANVKVRIMTRAFIACRLKSDIPVTHGKRTIILLGHNTFRLCE